MEVIILLCLTLVTLLLEYGVQFWGPHYRKGTGILGSSRGPPRLLKSWSPRYRRRSWDNWGFSTFRKPREIFFSFCFLHLLMEKHSDDRARIFSKVDSRRIRDNGLKLKNSGKFWLTVQKTFFTMRVIKHWNKLPERAWNLCPWRLLKVK